jgi:hypothetical protein
LQANGKVAISADMAINVILSAAKNLGAAQGLASQPW